MKNQNLFVYSTFSISTRVLNFLAFINVEGIFIWDKSEEESWGIFI